MSNQINVISYQTRLEKISYLLLKPFGWETNGTLCCFFLYGNLYFWNRRAEMKTNSTWNSQEGYRLLGGNPMSSDLINTTPSFTQHRIQLKLYPNKSSQTLSSRPSNCCREDITDVSSCAPRLQREFLLYFTNTWEVPAKKTHQLVSQSNIWSTLQPEWRWPLGKHCWLVWLQITNMVVWLSKQYGLKKVTLEHTDCSKHSALAFSFCLK